MLFQNFDLTMTSWLALQLPTCITAVSSTVDAETAKMSPTKEKKDDDVDKLFAQYEAEAAANMTNTEYKVKKQSQKPNLSMRETREAGLSQPIADHNRGFRMLAAMGYQPGHGIGKGNTGRTTPVPIEIKAGKQGLGIAENRKRKKLHDDQQRIQRVAKHVHMQQQMEVDHKASSALRAANRQFEAQLAQARQVCETLDRRQGLESSELWLAVPVAAADMPDPSAQQQAEEQDVETSSGALEASWEDWPVQAKLAHVLNHLRQSYCYCLYCGCQYKDEDDLLTSCPGLKEEDH